MQFAQFYHPSTGWNGREFGDRKLIPACGSDSVLMFDGRWRQSRVLAEARRVCKARGYNGFTLHAGASLLRERETRKLEIVTPLA